MKIKKNILAATTAAFLISTPALGNPVDTFYVKANVGLDKMNKMHGMKSNNGIFGGGGVGYYIMDNVRTDLNLDHYFNSTFKGSSIYDSPEDTRNGIPAHKVKMSHKVKIRADTLMLNAYFDMFDLSVAQVSIGAGAGVAKISAKRTTSGSAVKLDGTTESDSRSNKVKEKNNFAYALHLVASVELAPGFYAELAGSWRDLGKFKGVSGRFKGYHATTGVRVEV